MVKTFSLTLSTVLDKIWIPMSAKIHSDFTSAPKKIGFKTLKNVDLENQCNF